MNDVNENDGEGQTLQLLTFLLINEVFGADISQVQEVLEYSDVTRVPRMPDHMVGVINLRGQVLPVVDLRKQFHLEMKEITVDTCIIIVEVMIDSEPTVLGLIADAVKEVVLLDADQITPPPRLGTSIDTSFIHGMGKYNEQFVIILNLSKIFSQTELEEIADTSELEVASSEESDGELSELNNSKDA